MLGSPAQRSIDSMTPAKVRLTRLVDVVQAVKVQNDLAWITAFAQPTAPNPFQVQDIPASVHFIAKITAKVGMNHVGERPPQSS
jgi:hypothetical protein